MNDDAGTPPPTEPATQEDLEAKLKLLLELVTPGQQPNINALWRVAKEIPILSLNVKFFGYELARRLAAALPVWQNLAPRHVGLRSKPSTQADIESDWVAYWAGQMKIPVVFHRKIWELAYVLQAIHEHGLIREGASGIGFGCGVEAIPSLLAASGVKILVTDLAPEAQEVAGWARTNQHTAALENAYHPELVGRDAFTRNVALRYVDMNAIPDDLRGYDFCWSICALEHLGSIARGLAFIENSLRTLRPGGIAIHTTEFNFLDDEHTIDNWGTVLFQKRHFQALHDRLTAEGHKVAPLDFDVGVRPMDRFIDVPPFAHDWPKFMAGQWEQGSVHIKLSVDGFAATCFGLIIQRGGA